VTASDKRSGRRSTQVSPAALLSAMMEFRRFNDNKMPSVLKKRALLVDDQPCFRLGLAALLDEQRDLTVCGEAENAHSALDAIRRLILLW
jgi:hypothetical protein